MKQLVTALRGVGDEIRLHEVMEGSEVVVDPPEAPAPNPELVARRQKLQMMMDEKDYQRRTRRFEGRKGVRDK